MCTNKPKKKSMNHKVVNFTLFFLWHPTQLIFQVIHDDFYLLCIRTHSFCCALLIKVFNSLNCSVKFDASLVGFSNVLYFSGSCLLQ